VTNKWIHERGNEFRRRCGLKMSDGERWDTRKSYTESAYLYVHLRRFIGDLGFGPEPRHAPNMSPDLSKDIFNTI
ncbi:hypothetical protein GCK32_021695, partial [Trichostrongylus colubriformis]